MNKSISTLSKSIRSSNENETIGEALGGLINDWISRGASGLLKALNPLNMVKSIFGKRKNKKIKKEKDPYRSKTSPTTSVPVRKGDSATDILTKTYISLRNSRAYDLKQGKLDKKYRKELNEQNEDYFNQVMKILTTNNKSVAKQKDNKKTNSMLKYGILGAIGLAAFVVPKEAWANIEVSKYLPESSFFDTDNIKNKFAFEKQRTRLDKVTDGINKGMEASKDIISYSQKINAFVGDLIKSTIDMLPDSVKDIGKDILSSLNETAENYIPGYKEIEEAIADLAKIKNTFKTDYDSLLNPTNRKSDDTSGLHETTFNSLSDEKQQKLLKSQEKSEGTGSFGTVAHDLNNPGAMVYSSWQKEFGGKPSSRILKGMNGEKDYAFAEFPSMEQGRAAQLALWKKRYGDKPLDEALLAWVNPRNEKELEEFKNYKIEAQRAIGLSGETSGRITSGFGTRVHPITGKISGHQGIDIAAAGGTRVNATESGTVVKADGSDKYGYGNQVLIDHGNGIKTRYGHLSAIDVSVGDTVTAGQNIGKVGSTGSSTGNHLHYEIIKDGKPIDPQKSAMSNISPVGIINLAETDKKLGNIKSAKTELQTQSIVSVNNNVVNVNNPAQIVSMSVGDMAKQVSAAFAKQYGS